MSGVVNNRHLKVILSFKQLIDACIPHPGVILRRDCIGNILSSLDSNNSLVLQVGVANCCFRMVCC